MINRRRAHSPSPTILDLPNTPEPILPALCAISDEDEEEELEDYVVVARPLLEPPARRHSTSALSGRPAVPLASEKTLHPASPTESKFAAAPAPLSFRRSSFGASRPARLLSPPLFDRSSILVEPIPERPDFECLTSVSSILYLLHHCLINAQVLQARYRASSLTLSSSVPCPGSDTSSVSRSHGKLVKPRRPSHSDATIPHPSADPAASSGRKRPLSRPCTSNMAM
jgi:hypothetical protein